MDTAGISGYGTLGRTYAAASDSIGQTQTQDQAVAASSGSTLGIDDFLQLLAAQFQNQDITNPTDNTEFISELAQFSSLAAMNELTDQSGRQYASSLVGKTVVVGDYDKNGSYAKKQGTVQSAFFSKRGNTISVDGTAYNLSSVLQVVGASDASESAPGGQNGGEKEAQP